MKKFISDHEKQTITTAVEWLSRALGDGHHTASNVTRALRLFQGSSFDLGAFMQRVKWSHSKVIQRRSELRRPMAWFFADLEQSMNIPRGGGCPY